MNQLYISLVIIQVLLGMIVPLTIMAGTRLVRLVDELRKLFYFVAGILIQVGIFATRWNVVIGGQMFSKSFRGLTTYKMEITGLESLLTALGFILLPFLVLYALTKLLPPWEDGKAGTEG